MRSSRIPSVGVCALVATVLPSPAVAEETVPVTIVSRGQSWSIGGHGGVPCDPSCGMSLVPDKYLVTIGGAKQELSIRGPTEITYSPGAPKLRTIAGWTAVGALGGGAVLGGLAIYGFAKGSCTNGCSSLDFTVSKPVATGLIAAAAGLITVSVVGGILYAVSAEGLTMHEERPTDEPVRRRSFDVMSSAGPGGGAVSFVVRF